MTTGENLVIELLDRRWRLYESARILVNFVEETQTEKPTLKQLIEGNSSTNPQKVKTF